MVIGYGKLAGDTTREHYRLNRVQVSTADLNLLSEISSLHAQTSISGREHLQRRLVCVSPLGTVVERNLTTLGSQGHEEAYLFARDIGKVLSLDGCTRHTTGEHGLIDVVDVLTLHGHLVAGIQTCCRTDRLNLDRLLEGDG